METKQFIEYFREFYGRCGLYPIPFLNDEDIIEGIKKRGTDFEGDSIDRELIRDMIMWKKGIE
jgi:hypothetical protein